MKWIRIGRHTQAPPRFTNTAFPSLSLRAVKYNQRTVRRAHIKPEPLSHQTYLNSLRAIYVRGKSYEGDDRPTQNTRKLSTLPCFDYIGEGGKEQVPGGLSLPQYISNPDRSWHACYATSKHVCATRATLSDWRRSVTFAM